MERYTFKAKAKAKVLIGVFRGGSFGSFSAREVALLAIGGGSQTGMLINLRPNSYGMETIQLISTANTLTDFYILWKLVLKTCSRVRVDVWQLRAL